MTGPLRYFVELCTYNIPSDSNNVPNRKETQSSLKVTMRSILKSPLLHLGGSQRVRTEGGEHT